jgi:hypothetical protein
MDANNARGRPGRALREYMVITENEIKTVLESLTQNLSQSKLTLRQLVVS